MAHYAKVVSGLVEAVIVADQEFIESGAVGEPSSWVQTSYNTRGGVHYQPNSDQPSEDQSKALRKNYAGAGYSYSPELDAFIPPVPYPSWALNPDSCLWEPPTPYPTDGGFYAWDEEIGQWVLVDIPDTE